MLAPATLFCPGQPFPWIFCKPLRSFSDLPPTSQSRWAGEGSPEPGLNSLVLGVVRAAGEPPPHSQVALGLILHPVRQQTPLTPRSCRFSGRWGGENNQRFATNKNFLFALPGLGGGGYLTFSSPPPPAPPPEPRHPPSSQVPPPEGPGPHQVGAAPPTPPGLPHPPPHAEPGECQGRGPQRLPSIPRATECVLQIRVTGLGRATFWEENQRGMKGSEAEGGCGGGSVRRRHLGGKAGAERGPGSCIPGRRNSAAEALGWGPVCFT